MGLVWTLSECLEIWRRYPEVLSCDNIYNTNRYKMPFFQIIGITYIGSTFNAAFAVVWNEAANGFKFIIGGL